MNPVLTAAIIGGVLAVEHRSTLGLMLSQPICGGFLLGLILGSPGEGLLAGALFQMLFLGHVTLRGGRAPDLPLGGITAAGLYILAKRDGIAYPSMAGLAMSVSILAGIIVSVLGGWIYFLWEKCSLAIYSRAVVEVERGNLRRAAALHVMTLPLHFILGFLIVIAALPAGRSIAGFAAERVSVHAPAYLDRIVLLVPFIGVGSLIRLHMARSRAFWFTAGFLVAYVFILVKG